MYTVEAKALTESLNAALGAIALGSRSEAQSVILQFGAGIQVIAANSVAVFRTDVAAVCDKPATAVVSVLPETLLAYAKGVKQLVLDPQQAHLLVKGDRRMRAEVYYVGTSELPEFIDANPDTDMASVAAIAETMLQRAGSIRNRTDAQALNINLSWTSTSAELIVGDSYHMALITAPLTNASSGSLAMTADRLARILRVGRSFAQRDNEVVAWSDNEYLSITNQTTAVRTADSAKEAIGAAKRTMLMVDTAELQAALNSIINAADDTASVQFTITDTKVVCSIKSASSHGNAVFRPAKVQGAACTIAVSANHLQDCMGTLAGKQVRMNVLTNNVVSLESVDGAKIRTITAMATRGQG